MSAVRFLSQYLSVLVILESPRPVYPPLITSSISPHLCCYPSRRMMISWSIISRTCPQFHVILKPRQCSNYSTALPSMKTQHFSFPSPCFSSSYSSLSSTAAAATANNNEDDDYTQSNSNISIERQITPNHHLHHLATALLIHADSGNITETQITWSQLLNTSFQPSIHLVSSLITKLAETHHYDEIIEILTQLESRHEDFPWLPQIYSLSVSCFGNAGRLDLMESTLKQMIALKFPIDSVTSNAYLIYYSIFGSLSDTESAYLQLKKSRVLIEERAIKAVSFRFFKEKKYYKLGVFLRDVGLGRRNIGNLLWNLLILSYAVNFKMKSLQREFINMIESGFKPDLTTFNIRAIAFSMMDLFWDLHLSLEHMASEGVSPDIVTYGCVVDAYVEKRFGRNLDFGLRNMGNLDEVPVVRTEEFVFWGLGKGDFHSSAEAFMEFSGSHRDPRRTTAWSYRKLVHTYIKKQRRSNQIFWNY